MFKKKKKILRLDSENSFHDLMTLAQKHSENLVKQIEFVNNSNFAEQDKLLAKLTLMQMKYAVITVGKTDKIEITTSMIEWHLRAMLDMARHMQPDLPDGVYEYIEEKNVGFYNAVIDKAKS